jgi:hypothetical protein
MVVPFGNWEFVGYCWVLRTKTKKLHMDYLLRTHTLRDDKQASMTKQKLPQR